jgi:hypothetical protein
VSPLLARGFCCTLFANTMILFPSLVRPFLEKKLPSTTTSADSLLRIPISNRYSFEHKARSPQVRTMTFIPCSCRIYAVSFRIPSGFMVTCPLAQDTPPQIRFLYISSGIYLLLPLDSPSRGTPLYLVSGSWNQGPRGTFTPKFIAHAGRTS